MAWDANWRERVAWSKRSPEFGELTVRDGRPVMKYVARLRDRAWTQWVRLPVHPSILSAHPGNFLDYAALDWEARPTSRALAGAALARVYEELLSTLGSKRVAALTAPRVFYDLEGEVRVAFAEPPAASRFFSGVVATCNERELVQLVGELLQAMATPATESSKVALVIEKAVNRTPRTLAALRASFEATPLTESDLNHETWSAIEKGIGFLELDQPGLAAISFTKVLDKAPKCVPALDGKAAADLRIKELGESRAQRGEVEVSPPQVHAVRRARIDPKPGGKWILPTISGTTTASGVIANVRDFAPSRARTVVGGGGGERRPDSNEWDPEVLRRAAWAQRTREFGPLFVRGLDTAMTFGSTRDASESPLWKIWTALPPHPNILGALFTGELRYAAIDWTRRRVLIEDQDAPTLLATWGVTLTRIYEFLLRKVPANQLGWLTGPCVRFDLEGELRIGFEMGAAQSTVLAPEVRDVWPYCEECGLVFAIGQAVNALGADTVLGSALPIGDVVRRCVEPDPARRFDTLDVLRSAFVAAGGFRKPALGERKPRTEFDALERELGQWLVADPVNRAYRGAHFYTTAPRRAATAAGSVIPSPLPPSSPPRHLGGEPPAPVSTEPVTPARAAYVEGKAALVRGKLADARDAFDRALALQPQMLEAMLLRGEVERMTNRLRRAVGTGDAKGLPAHLAALEPLLAGDRFEEGIAQLRAFEDAAAQQLLADVLVERGRAGEALAIYDRLASTEAIAGRAAALQQLGRNAEAEAALDQFVALAVSRSELRTRGAQR